MYPRSLRRVLAVAGTAILAAGIAVVADAPAHADYAVYEVVARHSRRCLDVDNAYRHDGANVKQWSCATVPQQHWMLIPRNINGQALFLLVAQHSNKCLDVSGASQADGANVHQWSCISAGADTFPGTADDGADVPQQLWFMVKVLGVAVYDPPSNSYQPVFEVRARHSNKCLDVSGASTDNGANVHQWICVGQPQQHWVFRTLR